jgi:NFU1 iron-sulfur cluster scaffold homolog, mitochondrial
METTKIPVNVYAESTPNPATMKFVSNKLLVENGASVEYTDIDKAKESALASKLFNFSFVTGVFITSNFITVTKSNLVEWEDITMELREFIRDFLASGEKVFHSLPEKSENSPENKQAAEKADHKEPESEIEFKIIEILEEYIRPAVEQDGGAIHFKSYNEGVVTVSLRGACSGCPSSTITLKAGIQGLFQRMLPEVKEVVAEEV